MSIELLVGDWEATGLMRSGAFSGVLPDTRITAAFGPDGRVSGSAGCNRYTAALSTDGSSIQISSAAVTRMFCSTPEGVMEQEDSYLSLLSEATAFTLDGSTLELLGASDARLVSYARVEAG